MFRKDLQKSTGSISFCIPVLNMMYVPENIDIVAANVLLLVGLDLPNKYSLFSNNVKNVSESHIQYDILRNFAAGKLPSAKFFLFENTDTFILNGVKIKICFTPTLN